MGIDQWLVKARLLVNDTLTSGTQITGQISSSNDDDYYKISVSGAGNITVSFTDTGINNDEAYTSSTFDLSILGSNSNVLSAHTFDDSGEQMLAVLVFTFKMSSTANYDQYVDNDDYNVTATFAAGSFNRELNQIIVGSCQHLNV